MLYRASLRGRFGSVGALSALGLLLGAAPAGANVTLEADAAAAFDAVVVAEGLQQPVDVAVLPDGKVLVITRQGDVNVYSEPNGEPTTDHITVQSSQAEQGLLGVVIDPDFATNQFVYFYASVASDANNRHQVLRYKLGADGMLGEQTIVINMGLRGPANHNGGALDIHDGNLYIGVGDTGANAATPQNHFGSCLNIANGKVLRVSLADDTLGEPTADNPLVNETMVSGCESTSGGDNGAFEMFAPEKRIFAWGFRNPFRLWVDSQTGKVWVGDVGEQKREEISIVEKGKHYGYPFEEGTVIYNQSFKPQGGCMGLTPGTPCVPPAYDWDRNPQGSSIGGRILDGCGWPAPWKSRYIFGDYDKGSIWTLDVNAARDGVVADSVKEFASADGPTSFRMGTDNALYISEASGGNVVRLTAKGMAAAPDACPAINDGPPGNMGGGGAGGGGNPSAGSSGGGNPPSGGNGNVGGVPAAGGKPGNPSAGTSNNGTAGTSNNNPGSSGSGATGGNGGGDGCGCRVAGSGSSALAFAALAGALGVSLLRRRGARRS